jgi:transposase
VCRASNMCRYANQASKLDSMKRDSCDAEVIMRAKRRPTATPTDLILLGPYHLPDLVGLILTACRIEVLEDDEIKI